MSQKPATQKQIPSTPEIITVDPHVNQVMCNGGGGTLGHPAVYYTLDDQTQVECLYCDRVFMKK